MNEGCKGCVAYSDQVGLACNGTMNKNRECPCSSCLIKGMCKNECLEYSKFSISVYQRLKRGRDLEPEYYVAGMREIL